MAADQARSRVFRQVVTIEVIAIVGPAAVASAITLDIGGVVRDAVHANDTATPDVWLVAGESSESEIEELSPDAR